MQEDPLVRSIRRDLSRQLTAAVNNSATYPALRLTVLNSLSTLSARLLSLQNVLVQDLSLIPGQPLLYFYAKGGNAFECVIDPAGPAATQQGGGISDWDTQVVVDPWAPIPIQNYVYAAIEDLVLDELRKCAIEIAKWMPEFPPTDELLCEPSQSGLVYRYRVTRDHPQTIRKVYDHNRTGLWLNTEQPLSEVSMPDAELPGMTFNDSIDSFVLLRLGYTWHAEPPGGADSQRPAQPTGPQIDRPLLMELIDVSLPRHNTIEAVEIWEKFHYKLNQTRPFMITPTPVSMSVQGTPSPFILPLPSLDYHFDEQLLMLCEVAVDISKSVDKVAKRFNRLTQIYSRPETTDDQQHNYQNLMAAKAGIPLAKLLIRPSAVAAVDNALNNNGAAAVLAAAPGTANYLALSMMYYVANRVPTYPTTQTAQGRQLLNMIIGQLLPIGAIREVGFSDDQAVYTMLVDCGCLSTDSFPRSGIDMAALFRVQDPSMLDDIAEKLVNNLRKWLLNRSALAAAAPAPRSAFDEWVVKTFNGKQIDVKSRIYTVPRPTGYSRERMILIFCDECAVGYLTLTSSVASQAPFVPNPLPLSPQLSRELLASGMDMAEQRKVAAAAIDSFCIRYALAGQLNMLSRILSMS
jgi:hypothetical protein